MPEQDNADPSIKAMVLMGDGRSVIAEADIRGFGTGRKWAPIRSGHMTYAMRARSRWLRRFMGFALGGGLEPLASPDRPHTGHPVAKRGLRPRRSKQPKISRKRQLRVPGPRHLVDDTQAPANITQPIRLCHHRVAVSRYLIQIIAVPG